MPGDPAQDVYRVVFHEEHLVEPCSPERSFELQDYYDHPEAYRSRFEAYLSSLTILLNGICWSESYPRLVTIEALRRLYHDPAAPPRLRVIGDVSCDLCGSIECTLRCTTPDDPVFTYDPNSGEERPGVEGPGPVVLAVDNLPCELPADASRSFGDALVGLLPALARCDYARPFAELDLPPELERAVIVHRGELTPDYSYLSEFLGHSGS